MQKGLDLCERLSLQHQCGKRSSNSLHTNVENVLVTHFKQKSNESVPTVQFNVILLQILGYQNLG